eukprot:g51890.t1
MGQQPLELQCINIFTALGSEEVFLTRILLIQRAFLPRKNLRSSLCLYLETKQIFGSSPVQRSHLLHNLVWSFPVGKQLRANPLGYLRMVQEYNIPNPETDLI